MVAAARKPPALELHCAMPTPYTCFSRAFPQGINCKLFAFPNFALAHGTGRDTNADMDSGADVGSRTADKGNVRNESEEGRGSSNAIGDEAEVAGLVWKGVGPMGDDKRGGRPKSEIEDGGAKAQGQ